MSNAGKLVDPRSTALVVVDLQDKLMPAIDGQETVLANTKKLLHLARLLDLKTLVTTQYRKGLARKFHKELAARRDEPASTTLRSVAVLTVLSKYASARQPSRALYPRAPDASRSNPL